MNGSLTEYIIAVFELFEAELAHFKRSFYRMIIAFILLIIAGFLALIAFLFVVWGIFSFYQTLMQTYVASFATAGTLLLLVSAIVVWVKWRH